MATVTTTPDQRRAAGGPALTHRPRRPGAARPNWLGGLAGWVWLAVVVVPIYWIIITSFTSQSNYFASNPLVPTTQPTLENYQMVLDNHFIRYFGNSVVVTV